MPPWVKRYQEEEFEWLAQKRREFYDELVSARYLSGISQDDMAKLMRTTQSSIARLESGIHSRGANLNTLLVYVYMVGYNLKVIRSESP